MGGGGKEGMKLGDGGMKFSGYIYIYIYIYILAIMNELIEIG